MRKTVVLAALLAAFLVFSGCEAGQEGPSPSPSYAPAPTPTPAPLAQFTLAYDAQGTWDPYAGSGNANMALAPLVYEGLYALDQQFEAAPVLAASGQVSEDGYVWRFRLREGITFSDGTPLTAETAGRALLRAKGEKSAYAKRLSGVKSVTWDREGDLLLTLTAPNSALPALLDVPLAHVTEDGCFGTGPYTLSGEALTARRDWWQGKPLPLDTIALTAVTGADDLLAAFDSGRLSLAAADLTGADSLGFGGSHQTWDYPTSTMVYVGFNAKSGFCRDEGFRGALVRCWDRSALVNEVLEGHGSVASYPAPPESRRYDARAAEAMDYDPAGAALAFEELGFTLGEDGLLYQRKNPVSLTLLVNSDNARRVKLAQRLREDMEAVGITVTVQAVSWEDMEAALAAGRFDLYLAESRLTGDLDLTPYFTGGSGVCYGGFWDTDLWEALAAGRATGDFAAFNSRWVETAPFGVLCFKAGSVVTAWGRCGGLTPTQGDLFYGLENWTVTQ